MRIVLSRDVGQLGQCLPHTNDLSMRTVIAIDNGLSDNALSSNVKPNLCAPESTSCTLAMQMPSVYVRPFLRGQAIPAH